MVPVQRSWIFVSHEDLIFEKGGKIEYKQHITILRYPLKSYHLFKMESGKQRIFCTPVT